MPSQLKRGRPPSSQRNVLAHLRGQIVEGSLSPGSRLPTRADLCERLRVSSGTVQRAMDRLMRDGFIEARGRHGTFVAAHPPHLSRYGLVFPHREGKDNWPVFWHRVLWVARQVEAARPVQLPIFHDAHAHSSTAWQDYERLKSAVRNHRVAGLIFASSPHSLIETPVLRESNVPRVAVMEQRNEHMPDVVAVSLDYYAMFDRAIDALAERGRKRVALLTGPLRPEFFDNFTAAVAQRGLVTRPHWQHALTINHRVLARRWVRLLMNQPIEDRPDAIVVSDDNVAAETAAGLGEAGVRVGQELDLIAHANFPDPDPLGVPAIRIGFDARLVLDRCLNLVDSMRRGVSVPERTKMAPLFEDEVAASTTEPQAELCATA